MLEKSPEAFKTISEAAEELGVEQHVLRFWETRFPQIKPLKRRGGRRYYRPEDMDVLHRIRHLLYQQGFTIKGAKKALSAKAPAAEAAAAIQETALEVKDSTTSARRKAVAEKPAEEGQLNLLSPAPTAPASTGFSPEQRRQLEKTLAALKAARKGLQSAA